MSSYLKREIPLIITFAVGIIFIAQYFISDPTLNAVQARILVWSTLLGNTLLALGLINMFIIHTKKVTARQTGWPFSAWLLFGIIFTAAISFMQGIHMGVRTTDAYFVNWIVWNVNTQIQITIFSLFGFYVVSATVHGFNVRSLESLLFIVSGVIVFLWNAPIGAVIWEGFGPLGTWLSNIVAGGTYRAVTICLAVGSLFLGIRTLLGIDRGYLGAE